MTILYCHSLSHLLVTAAIRKVTHGIVLVYHVIAKYLLNHLCLVLPTPKLDLATRSASWFCVATVRWG